PGRDKLVPSVRDLRFPDVPAPEYEPPAHFGLLQDHVGPLDCLPDGGVFDGVAPPEGVLELLLRGTAAVPEVAERPPDLRLEVVGQTSPDKPEPELVKPDFVARRRIVDRIHAEELLVEPVQKGVHCTDQLRV